MNAYQKFALDHHLFAYPENASFEEVLEMIENYDDAVELYSVFCGEDVSDVIENIHSMAESAARLFVPREQV